MTISSTTKSEEESKVVRCYTTLKPKWDRYFPPTSYKTTIIDKSNTKPKNKTAKTAIKTTTTTTCVYNNQYSLMYTSRLEQLRKRICTEDDEATLVSRIIGLQDDNMNKFIVIGTIVKEYDNNVIKEEIELCDNGGSSVILPLKTNTYTTTENDENNDSKIVLEDESGRIELIFDDKNLIRDSNALSTGVVIGVKGIIESHTGRFQVEKLLYPSLPSPPKPQSLSPSNNKKRIIALISGLNIGIDEDVNDNNVSNALRRSLLIDYLSGHFDSTTSCNISRLIIAGGNIGTTTSSKKQSSASYAIHELDIFLSELCANGNISIDILPGKYDPTNANFPYRSLHHCLLPIVTKNYGSFINLSSNPYNADVDDRCFLGTDGSNILNFMHFTNNNDATIDNEEDEDGKNKKLNSLNPLQALEYTLRYNIIAPTAPDTIPAFPFHDNNDDCDDSVSGGDPLVMQYVPNVYFIGNCMEYQTKIITDGDDECRLICIPDFSKTGEIVLCDLDTLDCKLVKIMETLE